MKIDIVYSKKALKFLSKNNFLNDKEVDELVIKAIKIIKLKEEINLDLKVLKGYENFYRIRKGKIRIIFSINEDNEIIISFINEIGYRGDIYKK